MEEERKTIEINGVKLDVDMRSATKIDKYRVGDKVKVLIKRYSSYETHRGVIVAFDMFKKLPTITICYIKYGGELEFAYLNEENKDVEIVKCNDDVITDKVSMVEKLQNNVYQKQLEVDDAKRKLKYFEENFGAWFDKQE